MFFFNCSLLQMDHSPLIFGTLGASICSMRSLVYDTFGYLFSLTPSQLFGSVTACWLHMLDCRSLLLGASALSGSLPTCMSQMTSLQ